MIQIAFCDDDQTVLDQLSALLEKYRTQRCIQIQCTAFRSPLDLLAEVEKGVRYDILFLDVIMPAENGITVAKEIRQYDTAVEIICDGCHSTPAALNNYFMSKGPDYAIMISDALMAKGTPIGSEYIFGGNHITIYPDGSAHLDNGTLAGSTLNINKGLRILVEEAMVPFNYALNACTINPARCLHLDDRKGSIQIGKDADLVVLDDNYDVLQTYCMGKAQL